MDKILLRKILILIDSHHADELRDFLEALEEEIEVRLDAFEPDEDDVSVDDVSVDDDEVEADDEGLVGAEEEEPIA